MPLSSGLLSYIADYKGCTYELLDYFGFTAPKTRTFAFTPGNTSAEEVARIADQAVAAAAEIGYPVVTKPDAEAHGTGVTPNIRSDEELRMAVKWAMLEARRTAKIIVQSHVFGEDHRFLIIDYKGGWASGPSLSSSPTHAGGASCRRAAVFAVAKRVPAKVIGDGVLSIRGLIEKENARPDRGPGHTKLLTSMTIDESMEAHLESCVRWPRVPPPAREGI